MQIIPIQPNLIRKNNFIIIFHRVHISVHSFCRDPRQQFFLVPVLQARRPGYPRT